MYYGVLKVLLCYGFFLITSSCVSSWLSTIIDLLGFCVASLVLSWHLSFFFRGFFSGSISIVNPLGKCLLVTGCDTGFGHDIALTLNKTGFTVFAGCLFKDRPEAQSLMDKCSDPKKMILLSLDITKQEDIMSAAAVIERHMEDTGQVFYALVNNAGISGFAPFEWGSFKQDVQPVIHVNLNSSIRVTRAMIPLLIKHPGSRIVNMTSYVTHLAMPFLTTYCMSKCGLRAFSETLRNDLEEDKGNGMKVITIEPIAYKTGIVGYENIKNTIRRSWSRSQEEVCNSYGVGMFDSMVAFVSICEFFRFFDFIALKRNLHEVSEYVTQALVDSSPVLDVQIISRVNEIVCSLYNKYLPQDVIEACFSVSAYTGLLFMAVVAFGKKFLLSHLS